MRALSGHWCPPLLSWRVCFSFFVCVDYVIMTSRSRSDTPWSRSQLCPSALSFLHWGGASPLPLFGEAQCLHWGGATPLLLCHHALQVTTHGMGTSLSDFKNSEISSFCAQIMEGYGVAIAVGIQKLKNSEIPSFCAQITEGYGVGNSLSEFKNNPLQLLIESFQWSLFIFLGAASRSLLPYE